MQAIKLQNRKHSEITFSLNVNCPKQLALFCVNKSLLLYD